MRLADERTWTAAVTIAAYCRRSSESAAPPHPAELRAEELESWLCDPAAPAPSLDDLASAFGLAFDAPETDAPSLPPSQRLRFLLAVLRDVFPADGAVRRWLRTADATRGAERPLDLLLGGRVEQLEALAVREWNRHRLTTYSHADVRACAEPPAPGYDTGRDGPSADA